MKLKLFVTIAHPHLPGEEKAPDIFISVNTTEMQALQEGLRAIDVLHERQKDTGLRYAIETLPITLPLHPGWALLNHLLQGALALRDRLRGARDRC